jgi:hypothetical protein
VHIPIRCRLASAGIGCRWLPVWLPELAIFDLFMTLNRVSVQATRVMERLAHRHTSRQAHELSSGRA